MKEKELKSILQRKQMGFYKKTFP